MVIVNNTCSVASSSSLIQILFAAELFIYFIAKLKNKFQPVIFGAHELFLLALQWDPAAVYCRSDIALGRSYYFRTFL